MRSLAVRLTLAFMIVGLTGAVLVALFVGLRTQRAFDRFVLDRYQSDLLEELTSYYTEHGSWEGIGTIVVRPRMHRPGSPDYMRAPLTLVGSNQLVVYSGRRYQAGQQLSPAEVSKGIPIEIDGETVGLVLFETSDGRTQPFPESPESNFLRQVNQAILFGAVGAAAVALVLGVVLARTISRPVRELTEATVAVAQGELGHQVPVRTRDELGELAGSFNRMSSDLARSNRLRRQMTADIAHELRTPLSVILGYTEALSDGKLGGTPDMYEAMHGEAQLLSHLIDDLRTLSLADAGELNLRREPTEPSSCLERTAASHAPLAGQSGVDLRVEAAIGLPLIDVDRDRMAQVLGNLVSNALRYTPTGGSIVLSAQEQDGSVLIQVCDSGTGIDPEHLPHVFDRFYRADEARQQNGEAGLGLAIAKSIVELHGGQIEVHSTLGEGTTFSIRLPQS